LWLFQISY